MARTKRPSASAAARPVKRLAGGNPQIAKAEGDAPVQAYIEAMPGWQRDVGRQIHALIGRAVHKVCKAVKWNSPFFGVPGQGWFLSLHCFSRYVKVAFFRGTSLQPLPPGTSKQKEVRYLDIHEKDQIAQRQLRSWVQQAASLPGWELSSKRSKDSQERKHGPKDNRSKKARATASSNRKTGGFSRLAGPDAGKNAPTDSAS